MAAMPGGYTDIDAMLATDTRVPVTFKVTSTGEQHCKLRCHRDKLR